MNIMSDIEIAQSCTMKPITEIAETAGVDAKYLELYGNYKAKVDYRLLRENTRPDGKLVLVTAINPTPALWATQSSDQCKKRVSPAGLALLFSLTGYTEIRLSINPEM